MAKKSRQQASFDIDSYLNIDKKKIMKIPKGIDHRNKTSKDEPSRKKKEVQQKRENTKRCDGKQIAQNLSSKLQTQMCRFIRKNEGGNQDIKKAYRTFLLGLKPSKGQQNSQHCLIYVYLFLRANSMSLQKIQEFGQTIKVFLRQKINYVKKIKNMEDRSLDKLKIHLKLVNIFYSGEAEPDWQRAEQISQKLFDKTQKNRNQKIFQILKQTNALYSEYQQKFNQQSRSEEIIFEAEQGSSEYISR